MDYNAAMTRIVLYTLGFILFLIIGNVFTAISKEKKEQAQRLRREKADAEKERREQERDVHRAFVAQQRRLMTDSLRYDVMQRDGFRCQICGATAKDGYKLHVDHIVPVSKGGKTEMRNLRTLCERCNMGKGAKIEPPAEMTPEEFARQIEK